MGTVYIFRMKANPALHALCRNKSAAGVPATQHDGEPIAWELVGQMPEDRLPEFTTIRDAIDQINNRGFCYVGHGEMTVR